MKIRHESVEHLEFIAGIDENIGEAFAGLDFAVFRRDAFERPAGGGANRDNPAAVCLCLPNQFGGFFGNFVVLAVHFVAGHVVHLDRTEGAETDVQGNVGDFHALLTDSVHQLLGEMQAGSRRGSGAELMAVDCLIALLVLQFLGDIGRQGHLTDFVEGREEALAAVEVDNPVAVVLYPGDLRVQQSAAEGEASAFTGFFAGFAERLPAVAADLLQKQEFHACAGFVLDAVNPRRKHARVIGDNQVALVQIVDNIIEVLMLNSAGFPVKHQQP